MIPDYVDYGNEFFLTVTPVVVLIILFFIWLSKHVKCKRCGAQIKRPFTPLYRKNDD